MSFHAVSWAVRQSLPCTQKMVLVMLADRHNSDTGQCNPSHEKLAADCGLTSRSVIQQIEKLQEAGYLAVIRRTLEGLKKSNQYRLFLRHGVQISDVNEVQYDVNEVPLVVNVVQGGGERRSDKPVIEPVKNIKTPAVAVSTFCQAEKPESVTPGVWADFLATRKGKNARVTETAIAGIEREALKAGWTLDAALAEACMRGWQGFKASWVAEKPAAAASTFSRSPDRNAVPPVSAVWHESKAGIEAKALELGLATQGSFENFPAFAARIKKAASALEAVPVNLAFLEKMANERGAAK